jgi:hypothetical protein
VIEISYKSPSPDFYLHVAAEQVTPVLEETVLTIEPDLASVIDAYRLCEFATLGKDGTPIPWPAATIRRPDGTLLGAGSAGPRCAGTG